MAEVVILSRITCRVCGRRRKGVVGRSVSRLVTGQVDYVINLQFMDRICSRCAEEILVRCIGKDKA